MIGQQRNIMTQMGIDLWIPRDAMCQKMPPRSLWREQDQMAVETVTSVIIPSTNLEQPQQKLDAEIKKTSRQQHHENDAALPIEISNTVDAFQLQVLSLAEYILVIDALHIDQVQRQLWNNMKDALGAEYLSLDWPLAFDHFQNPQGQHIYLRGFFDVVASQKTCIGLGELPYLPATAIQLPSLAQMLQQPLLKQQLWTEIQRIKHEKSGGIQPN